MISQADRLLAFLRTYPRSSSLEITYALHLVNVTGRISDLRARGIRIDCLKGKDGVDRYVVIEKPEQMAWTA